MATRAHITKKTARDKMKVYFMQDGQPIEIKRSSELNIKLSKKEKEQLRQMRKHRSGTLTLELTDSYKEFKDKIKAQIKGNCSEIPNN